MILLPACKENVDFLNVILIIYGFLSTILLFLLGKIISNNKHKVYSYISIFLFIIIMGYQSILIILKNIKISLLTEKICKQEIIPMLTYITISIISITIFIGFILLKKSIKIVKNNIIEFFLDILKLFFGENFIQNNINKIKFILSILFVIFFITILKLIVIILH